jgi:protein arginine N-methyltransferase 2
MMGWEAPLMKKHAAAICRGGGGHYLNVGFGLGIVDNEIQVSSGQ